MVTEEQKRYRAKRKASQITDPSDLKEIREESKLEEVKDQMQIESSTQKFNVISNTGPIFKKIKLSEDEIPSMPDVKDELIYKGDSDELEDLSNHLKDSQIN